MPLSAAAPKGLQDGKLRKIFDALRHAHHSQAFNKLQRGTDDAFFLNIRIEPCQEGAINLDRVKGIITQQRQFGGRRAEVVQCETDAQIPQLLQKSTHRGRILNHIAFIDLQLETLWGQSGAGQGFIHLFGQVPVLRKLSSPDIHADALRGPAGILSAPARKRATTLLQYPVPQCAGDTGLLRHRRKLIAVNLMIATLWKELAVDGVRDKLTAHFRTDDPRILNKGAAAARIGRGSAYGSGRAMEKAMRKRDGICLLALMAALIAAGATASDDVPHRKAGWWQMTMHLPGARTMVRNLCLDATSDIRNNILKPRDGCTMDATKIAGGYRYKKICGGETTTGTAIGDFNTAYKIEESNGSMQIRTDARWMGACPAGHKADEMWLN